MGAGIAGMMSWLNFLLDWQTSLLILPVVYLIYRSYRLYLGRLEDETRHVGEIADLHMRTIEALGAFRLKQKTIATHDHLQRVRVYAVGVAKELNLSAAEMDALQAAALLHDIGKLAMPGTHHLQAWTPHAGRIRKNEDPPGGGGRNPGASRFPYPVVPIVRAHHEKFDG